MLECLIYSPSACVKYIISSPYNLNFGVIPTWLEKILNLVPLRCLEMLPNFPDMWHWKTRSYIKIPWKRIHLISSLNVRMSYLFLPHREGTFCHNIYPCSKCSSRSTKFAFTNVKGLLGFHHGLGGRYSTFTPLNHIYTVIWSPLLVFNILQIHDKLVGL